MKTATCSSLWEWEAEGNPVPEPGLITIVLDGRGEPLCIVETVEVTVRKYNEVDANFARDEGEGDLSLNTGARHIKPSSRAPCRRSAKSFQRYVTGV